MYKSFLLKPICVFLNEVVAPHQVLHTSLKWHLAVIYSSFVHLAPDIVVKSGYLYVSDIFLDLRSYFLDQNLFEARDTLVDCVMQPKEMGPGYQGTPRADTLPRSGR